MAKVKITNKVFKLKRKTELKAPNGEMLTFNDGQEFHIVADVLYMNGILLIPGLQKLLINWILNNKNLFVEDTRIF